ncbi:DNA primase [Cytophagaceae bacterium ABcell3]|nr:DNA primase [Cytophagaceae bacterium ABcell3]
MRISPEIIDQVHQHVSIEEVVSDFITLKKKGQYLMACCPFHNEKTPSFTVTPSKGIYKCFGCGKAGDAFNFLMDIEGINYLEAVKWLAGKYGIEIKEEEESPEVLEQRNEKESLFIILNYAKDYYHDLLLNNEDGKAIGLSYFRERGFSDQTIKKFDLGYSLDIWDGLTKSALEKSYSVEYLEKAGLSLKKEKPGGTGTQYDRFRGRVIFPIHNLTGRVIAFGARILKQDKKQPKYLNSPETEVYHKSQVLYGIYQARQAIRQKENCLLVEGYTDVISLHQAGIENVVSSSGTSLTVEQIKLVKRFTDNITVLYDGDAAGIKASLRGTDLILEEGLNVHICVFPDGDDPDSFIRKVGGEAFAKFIEENSKDFITFKTELALKDVNGDPVKKAVVIREIVDSISKVADSIKRSVFFRQCAVLLDIDEGVLITEYNKIALQKRLKKKKDFEEEEVPVIMGDEIQKALQEPAQDQATLSYQQEREIMRLLVSYGKEVVDEQYPLLEYIVSETQDISFSTPAFAKLIEIIRSNAEKGILTDEQYLLRHADEDVRKTVIDLVTNKYSISEGWTKFEVFIPSDLELLSNITHKIILRLKKKEIEKLIKENQKTMLESVSDEDLLHAQQVHMHLKSLLKEIVKELGTVIG